MTNPDETSPVTPLDPSDPRWVEDILARARQRAEESQTAKSAVPPHTESVVRSPVEPAPPATVAPILEQPPAVAPARGARQRPTVDLADSTSDAPRRSPRPQPRADTPERSIPQELADFDRQPQSAVATKPAAPVDDDDKEEEDQPPVDRRIRNWIEWGGVIVGALLVAFLIRAVFFQAFYIPSESMESTLNIGDRILVNKLSYKFHDVNRGDLIVFEKPAGETSALDDLIKRVIALPGETIEQRGSDLYIDRGEGPQLLTESYVNEPNNLGPTITWVQGCANPATETDRCTIPEGHLWVMGDNRGHSRDSRFFGPVDEDLIVGRAFIKVWPFTKIGFL